MTWVFTLASTVISFLFLMALFVPLEKLFPAARQKFFRPGWLTDVAFFTGQYCLWTGCVLAVLQAFRHFLDLQLPAQWRVVFASQPWWVQALEVIFLSDVLVYWGHRIQHQVGFLWRFHSIHHTAEHLDWLAAHREHPIDTVYTMGLINLPAFALGFPLESIAGLLAFRGLWAIFIHSNVRLPLGPLRWVVGAPELHHWHHSKERFVGNYANISPLMDILFRTHHCPPHEPESYGINEETAKSYLGHLWHPFRPRAERRAAMAEGVRALTSSESLESTR